MQKPNAWGTALFNYLKFTQLFASLLLVAIISACASSPSSDLAAASEPPPDAPDAALKSLDAPPSPLSIEQQVAFDRGVAALADGNGVVAVEVFSQLGQQLPKIAAMQANLGSAYMLQGNGEQAIAAYLRAVALQPGLAVAYVRLGVLFRRANRLQDAEKAYKAALAGEPDNRLAHLNLGILYDLYLRQPAQALQHYERFQTLSDSEDAEVALWIADLKQRL